MKKLKSLKKWNSKGRRIHKGSKAKAFNEHGVALFSKEQTYEVQEDMFDDENSSNATNYNQGNFYFGGDNPDPMDYDLGLCGQ